MSFKGLGSLRFKDNVSWYQGEFQDNEIHGKGKLFEANRLVTSGNFVKGELCGLGSRTFSSGATLYGNFTSGKFGGVGKLVSVDGKESYEGEFDIHSFLPNGYGEKITQLNKEKVTITGSFSQGQVEGNAKVVFDPSGETYIGEFRANYKHGFGRVSF